MARGCGATVGLVLLGLGLALAVIVLAVVLSRHQAPCSPQAFAHAAVAADSKVCSDIGRGPVDRGARGAPRLCRGPPPPWPPALGAAVPAHHRTAPRGACGGPRPQPVPAQWLPAAFLAGVNPALFFNGTEPLRPQDPLPWPALATTLETVATEGAEVFYTGRLGQMLVEDIAKEGSQLTLQDLAKFQPEVVDALEVPLGDYSLYSPPPPAGGAILSFILNVLRGFNFSAESVARPEGRVNMYHHLVETLKFARGQRWRLRDPRSHPKLQNASQDLLGETLAQLIRQQIDGRGDHQLSHYSLAEAWGHGTGTSHVSVLGEDGSAVAATSTINTPFGAMVYSPRTGIILNNELLDLCERCPRGSGTTPSPAVNGDRVGGAPGGCWPPVPGERSPSSMVPSILISKAQGSKLVIGGAGGELIISAVAQAIMNKLWLGFDLRAAIAAPILHVNSKGRVEYEPSFSQEVQRGLQDRGQNQTQRPFFLNVVQAVSQEGACVYAVSDLRKGGEAAGY
ncbi:glutathione hydrolase 5 proenzyme isoform X6 [Rhinopithecus roxellana]|uniref:glutathione hydrolase 5 proenzyme isoform X6 n=1 Tax=Rhinopithecus roxellana TaxID=61622 RepID=UPI0012371A54|nr:glutathione hydrolase 5 proenzyme isoform X6 [Rhinopithecus roxellana]